MTSQSKLAPLTPKRAFIALAGLILLLAVLGFYFKLYPLQLLSALLLISLAPGWGLLSLLAKPASLADGLAWIGAVIAVSYALVVLVLLGVTYLAGAITPLGMLVAFGLGFLLWLGLLWRGLAASSAVSLDESGPKIFAVGLALLLALAAFLRLWAIYYSDLQGDEAEILLRATQLVLGTKNSLLTHSKGPAEILLVAAMAALTYRLDELTARLPFALANLGGILGVMVLARRLFGSAAGWIAGGLLAINGVLVTYARTAQYQSVMLLFNVWAAYFFYLYYQQGRRRWLFLGAFLLAAAFLTHFEAVLIVPLPLFLVWRRLSRPDVSLRRQWPALVGAAGLLAVMVGAFYLPALLNPQLRETGDYLAGRIGSSWLYNNFPRLYSSTLTYNAYYYLFIVAILWLFALLLALVRAWPWRKIGLLVGLLTACSLLIFLNYFWPAAQPLYLLGLSLAVMALIVLPNRLPETARALVVWAAPAWLVYLFLVVRPGNHYYVFFPAAALLLGWSVSEVYHRAGAQWLKVGLGVILGTGLALCAYYQYILVIRNDLEYLLTYPQYRQPLFITDSQFPFGVRIGFGFPYRLGWQAVSQLKRTQQLNGTWAANDGGNTPNWYMLNTPQTLCYPDYVIQAQLTYKDDPNYGVPFKPENFGYVPRYRLWGNNRLRMTILEFNPTGQIAPVDLYETAYFDPPVTPAHFVQAITPSASAPQVVLSLAPVLGEGSELKNNAPPAYIERAKQLKGRVALAGYDLDTRYARPGGIVPINLYWQTQELLSLRYKVFVHLISPQSQTWGQADGFPVCGLSHANTWPLGATVLDRHLLKLPPDIPPGDYTLVVGMYEPELNLRLNYFDVAGNEQGNSFYLTSVVIQSDQQ